MVCDNSQCIFCITIEETLVQSLKYLVFFSVSWMGAGGIVCFFLYLLLKFHEVVVSVL